MNTSEFWLGNRSKWTSQSSRNWGYGKSILSCLTLLINLWNFLKSRMEIYFFFFLIIFNKISDLLIILIYFCKKIFVLKCFIDVRYKYLAFPHIYSNAVMISSYEIYSLLIRRWKCLTLFQWFVKPSFFHEATCLNKSNQIVGNKDDIYQVGAKYMKGKN